MRRFLIAGYAVLCYVAFLAVFVYAVGFVGGLGTPTSFDQAPTLPAAPAIAIDVALLLAFAAQHSVMARQWFKRAWTRLVPEAVERSTYVLVSSAAMALLFAAWQGVGPAIWHTEGFARTAVIAIYLGGWALVFVATCLIDHFELFGLRQAFRAFRGRLHTPPAFRTPWLYRWVRHPLYVGWLVVFWAAPTMTVGHLVAAAAVTGYILVAIRLEERDLLRFHGDDYARYRQAVPMLIPRWRRARAANALAVQAGGATAENDVGA